jgi:hypothetical protein
MKKKCMLILCLVALFNIDLIAQNNESKLLPSEALTLMINAVDMHPNKERIDATKPYLSRVITKKLSKKEQFYLGEVYFWNFMPTEGLDVYSKLMNGNDDIARASWQRAMQINFLAFQETDKVEKQLSEFRQKFKPIPEDLTYMFGQVSNIAGKYQKEESYSKVLELIRQELKTINYDGAYKSFQLPAYYFNSYKALGKENEALKLLEDAKLGLEQTLTLRNENVPKNDPDYLIHTSRVKGMETIVTDKLSYIQMNKKFEELISSIEKAINYFKNKV